MNQQRTAARAPSTPRSGSGSDAHLPPGRRIALVALVAAQFLAMLDSSILNVALPSITQDLTLTAGAASE